jgi:hypothetical protein
VRQRVHSFSALQAARTAAVDHVRQAERDAIAGRRAVDIGLELGADRIAQQLLRARRRLRRSLTLA